MREIDPKLLGSEEFKEYILANQQPIPVRRSDQEKYFLLNLNNPGTHNAEASYVMNELMRLYAGKSLITSREGKDDHQYKINQLQGRSDEAFAICLEINENGEIQRWNPELFVEEEDYYWWHVATSSGVAELYLKIQEEFAGGTEWVDKYIYARIAHDSIRLTRKQNNKEALDNFISEYNRYIDENPDEEDVLTPVMKAVTKIFEGY